MLPKKDTENAPTPGQPVAGPNPPVQPTSPAVDLNPLMQQAQASPNAQPFVSAAPAAVGGALATGKKSFFKSKKFFGGLGGIVLLFIAVVLFVVFVYLPNTPKNVWRRGMASIGVGLEAVTSDSLQAEPKASEFKSSLNITSPFEASFDYNGVVNKTGSLTSNIGFSYDTFNPSIELVVLQELGKTPGIYFKTQNLEDMANTLASSYAAPGYTGYETFTKDFDNKWWSVDFEKLVLLGVLTQEELDEFTTEELTQDELKTIMAAMQVSSDKYMFTSDYDNMILQYSADLGKEDYEGVESRKYDVELNKENLRAYLKDLRTNLLDTGLMEKLGIEEVIKIEARDSAIDNFVEDIDTDIFKLQAWVALDSKILRNVRIIPSEESGYIDISLLLEGKSIDTIPMRLKVVLDNNGMKGEWVVGMSIDTQGRTAEGYMNIDIKGDGTGIGHLVADGKWSIEDLLEAPEIVEPQRSESVIDYILSKYEALLEEETALGGVLSGSPAI